MRHIKVNTYSSSTYFYSRSLGPREKTFVATGHSLVHWKVSLCTYCLQMCLSWTVMRAMNSATCRVLAVTASATSAVVCAGSEDEARDHRCPLRRAPLTSAASAPAAAAQSTEQLFQLIQQKRPCQIWHKQVDRRVWMWPKDRVKQLQNPVCTTPGPYELASYCNSRPRLCVLSRSLMAGADLPTWC